MNDLAAQPENTKADTVVTGRTMDEVTRADRLVREMRNCADNKTLGKSGPKRRRNLVNANKYEVDLERERKCATRGRTNNKTAAQHCKVKTLTVTSWKMNEYEYANGTLPTLARGLFTYQDPLATPLVADNDNTVQGENEEADSPHHILIRGYDKFFNIGEVKKTQLDWIATNTEGPYEVTLKENGCIIFMAGLPPHLVGPQGGCVVSSKHCLGDSQSSEVVDAQQWTERSGTSVTVSHALKGREWLEKTLAAKGRTTQEFGLWLWNNNLTAVAELCDDDFEEHILRYPAERAGLYLHGLNRNTVDFQTLPSGKVQQTAAEWGFRRTDFVTFNTYKEVMDFAEEVRNAGEYDHRPVEGFVVRCKTKQEGATHFYKIKYDEPYLMYREWREITKHLWSAETKKAAKDYSVAPLRMKYPLTKEYVEFVRKLMKTQPELFTLYNKNQGIIAVRDMFLQEWKSKSPQEQEKSLGLAGSKKPKTVSASNEVVEDYQRTVVLPIATIGCGKTTVSVALSKLFGWAHVSSDDFQHMRKSGSRFLQEIVNQLKDNMVVIADRTNFEYMHRQRIMNVVRGAYPKARFVALYWSHDEMPAYKLREFEVERVRNRGSNHQNLTPEFCPEFESVIQRFLTSFQPLNTLVEPDSNFSCVIESRVGEESLLFVERIVKEFAIPIMGAGGVGNYPIPTPDQIKEAVRFAREDWKPARVISGDAEKCHTRKLKNEVGAEAEAEANQDDSGVGSINPTVGTKVISGKSRWSKDPKYFAIALEPDAVHTFLERLGTDTNGSKSGSEWAELLQTIKVWKGNVMNRSQPHVTLIHASTCEDSSPTKAQHAQMLWKLYTDEVAGMKNELTAVSSTPMSSDVSLLVSSMQQSLSLSTSSSPALANKANGGPREVNEKCGAATALNSVENKVGIDRPDLQATVTVDYMVWSERIMALHVSSAKRTLTGEAYESTQASLHITVGKANEQVKSMESNTILELWKRQKKGEGSDPGPGPARGSRKGKNKAEDESTAKDGEGSRIRSVKLDKVQTFTGRLKGMMY
ncbi:hypothetical protein BX616_005398 [Lobosporangium transversale]|uniref:RNA ligase-domain-containing protein n=1 Tax=Lobosporangium transversale TaxID=64571 RepID=A0A1Y2GAK3_9FUNG|nr:RNA ligase-domain-containing protein [Lobosporangium transversale]KAF9919355.1 hypothetical protein BX616_005398 [Lobosporangium transversale]ORZ05550.1 RNA ligase-domain-containing protein [Lobosporangium transversale]|eukprot:XP_021877124.1 RNA ligase-domain-containing protein [Lobosporangium transversale]